MVCGVWFVACGVLCEVGGRARRAQLKEDADLPSGAARAGARDGCGCKRTQPAARAVAQPVAAEALVSSRSLRRALPQSPPSWCRRGACAQSRGSRRRRSPHTRHTRANRARCRRWRLRRDRWRRRRRHSTATAAATVATAATAAVVARTAAASWARGHATSRSAGGRGCRGRGRTRRSWRTAGPRCTSG